MYPFNRVGVGIDYAAPPVRSGGWSWWGGDGRSGGSEGCLLNKTGISNIVHYEQKLKN